MYNSQENLADKVLMSSQDATKISLTIKGLLLQLVPVILIITSQLTGFEAWDEATLVAIIETASRFVAVIIEGVSLLMIVWGLIRKLAPAA